MNRVQRNPALGKVRVAGETALPLPAPSGRFGRVLQVQRRRKEAPEHSARLGEILIRFPRLQCGQLAFGGRGFPHQQMAEQSERRSAPRVRARRAARAQISFGRREEPITGERAHVHIQEVAHVAHRATQMNRFRVGAERERLVGEAKSAIGPFCGGTLLETHDAALIPGQPTPLDDRRGPLAVACRGSSQQRIGMRQHGGGAGEIAGRDQPVRCLPILRRLLHQLPRSDAARGRARFAQLNLFTNGEAEKLRHRA